MNQIKSYNSSLKSRKATYKKLTGKDIDKDPLIIKQANKIKKDATKIVKQNKDNPLKMVKLLHVLIFKQIEDIFVNMKDENEKKNALELSIQTYSVVVTINAGLHWIIRIMLTVLFGPVGSTISTGILVTIIAPVVEEFAKKHAIENGYGETYINIFSLTEAITYLFDYGFSGTMLVLRFMLIIIHRGTYKFMRSTAKEDSEGNLKVNNVSFILAMFMHSFHNGMVLLESGTVLSRTVSIALIGAISTSIKDYRQYKDSAMTESINPNIIPMY